MPDLLIAAVLTVAWIASLIIAFLLGASVCIDAVKKEAKAGLITLSGRAWRTTEVHPSDKGGDDDRR